MLDIVIGREGTPLANKIVSIGGESCLISKLKNGARVKTIKFDESYFSVAVNKAQTLIALGTSNNVTFIETTNFIKVKKVSMIDVHSEGVIRSIAFNNRNDCMLAVKNDEVHSFSPN